LHDSHDQYGMVYGIQKRDREVSQPRHGIDGARHGAARELPAAWG